MIIISSRVLRKQGKEVLQDPKNHVMQSIGLMYSGGDLGMREDRRVGAKSTWDLLSRLERVVTMANSSVEEVLVSEDKTSI